MRNCAAATWSKNQHGKQDRVDWRDRPIARREGRDFDRRQRRSCICEPMGNVIIGAG
jgi:hypothetical protein